MICANRNNIYRLIRTVRGIKGHDRRDVAIQVVALLNHHPAATRKVEEILQDLLDEHRAVFQGGVLRLASEQERLELIQRDREDKRRHRRTKDEARSRQAYAAACREERRRLTGLMVS